MGYPRGALHVPKGTAFELPPYSFLCTRVYTVVYPRVHCCIHACTQRRSLLLRIGALLNSINGLSSALQLAIFRHRPYAPINQCTRVRSGREFALRFGTMGRNALPLQTQIQARRCTASETNEEEKTKRGQRRLRENLRRSLVVRKKAVPLQPQNERRVAGSDCDHDDV